ncbi:MetQ/NlpA family ABC transporter substrate-binding protein [Paenibacillus sp. GSMTC-2017]|uniref:MetQ/NlpA family ABC transporter substrate-binding protein n=1 Tax=Paenibacillus sp. GSMTC-2017 TaxID=2794350 RepID=UPI0018D8FEA6|nr:MetQ/NlpA family ABC transporter substrate-binding protein [Paenibacillus sp. GSMTC-2017]MBH5319081.1 MetQ/NlpA family ABC transporter substrate-binding protein [Paenibacillus sp. GSMTC-2017]
MKKRSQILIALLALVVVLVGCGGNGGKKEAEGGTTEKPAAKEVTIKVGASPVPHVEILNSLIPVLKEQGVNLEVIEFNDYVQPNVQVFEKQLDANFFQHVPYLDQFNKDKGYDLVKAAGIHVEPFGVYSSKIKKIDELKDGAKIAIPNDPSNGGRSLHLLAQHGLIELNEGAGVEATLADIKNNPRKFEFVELEAATLPRVLGEFDIAAINTNYALAADLNPLEDALLIEDKNSPYVNILVTRPDNKDNEAIQKLVKALKSAEVEKFINDKYKGAVIPAFD